MARIFSEGFEMGDTLCFDIDEEAGVDVARSGNYGMGAGGAGGVSRWGGGTVIIPEADEIYVRFGYYVNSLSDTSGAFQFKNGDAVLCSIQIGEPGTLSIYVGGTSVTSLASAVTASTWQLIEVRFKIHDSEGIIDVRKNGVSILSYSGDTKPDSNTVGNRFRFYVNHRYTVNMSIDDLAINDTTGTEDNSWCGDGHILRIAPNANGDNSDFVGNDGDSTDNYLLVDEVPADDDTTFVVGENISDYDLYNFADSGLPAEQIIKRVWVEGTAKDPESGNASMLVQSGSTLAEDDADQALSSAYGRIKSDEYTTDPHTGEAWEEANLNAIQAGMKVKS